MFTAAVCIAWMMHGGRLKTDRMRCGVRVETNIACINAIPWTVRTNIARVSMSTFAIGVAKMMWPRVEVRPL